MVHLRIVVPRHQAQRVLDLLDDSASVSNLVYLEGAARRPAGDVVLCDVAREEAAVIPIGKPIASATSERLATWALRRRFCLRSRSAPSTWCRRAGTAGMLSLISQKSSALMGVLISVGDDPGGGHPAIRLYAPPRRPHG